MPFDVEGFTPPDLPDPATVPTAPPKRGPRAADEREQAWPSGDPLAAAGLPGLPGLAGAWGANNADGGDTPGNLALVVGGFRGTLDITIQGGNGGKGGDGGSGGPGGEGQDGGQGGDEGPDAPGGQGGRGGQGGMGGNGGDGGAANSFDLYLPDPDEFLGLNSSVNFAGGLAGPCGAGGSGGSGGPGGVTGGRAHGTRAADGPSGTAGAPGSPGLRPGGEGQMSVFAGMRPGR
jgi:hypothetical protein